MKSTRLISIMLILVLISAAFSGCGQAKNNPVRIETEKLSEEKIASREWLPEYDTLTEAALSMRERSHAPYSHYAVGAALLGEDGTVYTGCNVENASYPVGICAERTAFSKAVSEGCQKFRALVIVGASDTKDGSDFCAPCGMCRQFIREFCAEDFPIILVHTDETGAVAEYKIYELQELLTDSFGPDNLE